MDLGEVNFTRNRDSVHKIGESFNVNSDHVW